MEEQTSSADHHEAPAGAGTTGREDLHRQVRLQTTLKTLSRSSRTSKYLPSLSGTCFILTTNNMSKCFWDFVPLDWYQMTQGLIWVRGPVVEDVCSKVNSFIWD